MTTPIVIWRKYPMDVNLGVFSYLNDNWDGDIQIISDNDFPAERKQCGWNTLDDCQTILSNVSDSASYVENIIQEYKNAIHIFPGVRDVYGKRIASLKKTNANAKIVIIAERPAFYKGAGIKQCILNNSRNLFYCGLAFYYRDKITAFLAMGESGVSQYKRYGFRSDSLFQYMYCPFAPSITDYHDNNNILKMVYIGRFDYVIKGVDILINAINSIDPLLSGLWELDMVGGYGNNANEIINWCNTKENVNYIGSWDYYDVTSNLRNYDVCVVPSRYDGWNLTPNQAINAGIATIVSNNAVSDELIRYSGAGIVYENPIELKQAIEKMISNRDELSKYKECAKNYQKSISPAVVGNYLLKILLYVNGELKEKPSCPWSVKK